jgi:ferredoxin-NADP reductase/ferredoxin
VHISEEKMTDIKFYDRTVKLQDGETVLDGLLRHGIEVPNGCRAGACQACMMQVQEGELPRNSQVGLKNTQQSQGFFLSCQCKPSGPLAICFTDQGKTQISAKVIDKEKVSAQVLRVRLEQVLDFRSGQYLNIWHDVGDKPLVRSYSIASVPQIENFIELHIKIIPDGRFSRWAADELDVGSQLNIQGALGSCFYVADDPHKPLLFLGIGTGLAPLYGILRDALLQGHQGSISLVLGARTPENFYLREELNALERDYPQLDVNFVCQSASAYPGDIDNTDIYQFVKRQFPNTKGVKTYLCGAESFVRKMKKQIFLSGAAMGDIHADAFLPCS